MPPRIDYSAGGKGAELAHPCTGPSLFPQDSMKLTPEAGRNALLEADNPRPMGLVL